MKFDLTTFGEAMIRISVRPGQTLENATRADLSTGGSEANTAVCLARLGMKAAWVSRLTDNPLGRRVERDLLRHGVDTSGVIWTKGDRVGTYYVEYATPPRAAAVTYDRRHAAVSRIAPSEMDWKFLLNTRVLHLTGITPALSPSCRQAVALALHKAQAKKIPVSFDVNYRAKLWTPGQAAKTLAPLLRQATIVIMTRADAAALFKLEGEPAQVVRKIQEHFLCPVAALTVGSAGCWAWDGKTLYEEPGYPLQEVVDRLGAGDAFSAGFIYGFLHKDLLRGLEYGVATSAMKLGLRGDHFWSSRAEVEQVIRSRGGDVRR
jgi:2-dehydro-3-deoxygluconokinase